MSIGTDMIAFRVAPTAAALALLFGLRVPPDQTARADFKTLPWLGLCLAIAMSTTAAFLFGRSPFAIWKTIEYLVPVALGIRLLSLPIAYVRYTFVFVLRAGFVVLLSAMVLVTLSPSRALRVTALGLPQITGTFPFVGPGALGLLGACALIMFVSPQIARKGQHAALARFLGGGIALVGLLLSQSRTTFVALIVLWALSSFSAARMRSGIRLLARFFVGSALMLAIASLFPVLLTRNAGADFLTFSNRTLRWSESVRLIRENPFWGNGLGVAARFEDIAVTGRRSSVGFGQAHNAYLELALSVGVPVTILIVLGFFGLLVRARRLLSGGSDSSLPEAPSAARVVAVCVVSGFANTFVVTYSLTFVVFVAALALVHRELVSNNIGASNGRDSVPRVAPTR